MFSKTKFKKIDAVLYKGYEIPIYSDGISTYVGFPTDPDENPKQNYVYNLDDLSKIKSVIYHKSKGNEDVKFPKPYKMIDIETPKKNRLFESKKIMITENQLKYLITNI